MADVSLALIEKAPARLQKPKKQDRDLWLMKRRGWTDDQLAARFGMKEHQIKAAIERYQILRDSFANEEVDLELNQLMTRMVPKVEKVLTDGMKAEEIKNVGLGKQVIRRKVADHATRLRTVEVLKGLMESARPKGGGIQVNTQVNNGTGQPALERPRGFDFESRLRDIRAKKGLDAEESVIDGDFEDDEKDVLADELAEMGIELEDDEDDDEDDE